MSNTKFALIILLVTIIIVVASYLLKPDDFPTGNGGTALLRDPFITMNER